MSKKKMKKIGLTGVIGAGKSSVIAILKDANIMVLDCDQINAELLKKGNEGYIELVKEFGSSILNTKLEIDTKKMSDCIFKNPTCKQKTEQILHPLIKEKINKLLLTHHDAIVVVEVPLLFEVKWESFFDEVWVVASDESILLQRLVKDRKMDIQDAKRRLSSQMPQAEKVKKADVVFYNNSDKESLKCKIYDILKKITNE